MEGSECEWWRELCQRCVFTKPLCLSCNPLLRTPRRKAGVGALQTILPFCQLDPFRCTHGGRRRHEGKGEGTSHSCMISLYFVSILWPLSQQQLLVPVSRVFSTLPESPHCFDLSSMYPVLQAPRPLITPISSLYFLSYFLQPSIPFGIFSVLQYLFNQSLILFK